MHEREARFSLRMKETWQSGVNTYFHRGTNGCWKDVLSSEELALHDQKAAQVLTLECRAWLEHGRVSFRSNFSQREG